jgi:hypothetical protein
MPGVRPRKGCFEVRIVTKSKPRVVLSIIQARPFPRLKALDMEKVHDDVLAALKK